MLMSFWLSLKLALSRALLLLLLLLGLAVCEMETSCDTSGVQAAIPQDTRAIPQIASNSCLIFNSFFNEYGLVIIAVETREIRSHGLNPKTNYVAELLLVMVISFWLSLKLALSKELLLELELFGLAFWLTDTSLLTSGEQAASPHDTRAIPQIVSINCFIIHFPCF
jgi:hypothetical protein